jgi:hypothetical protein
MQWFLGGDVVEYAFTGEQGMDFLIEQGDFPYSFSSFGVYCLEWG